MHRRSKFETSLALLVGDTDFQGSLLFGPSISRIPPIIILLSRNVVTSRGFDFHFISSNNNMFPVRKKLNRLHVQVMPVGLAPNERQYKEALQIVALSQIRAFHLLRGTSRK